MTNKEIAASLGIAPNTLFNIFNEHKGLSSEMAIRLSKDFGSKTEFCLKLQLDYELWKAEKNFDTSKIKPFLPVINSGPLVLSHRTTQRVVFPPHRDAVK